jgi:hypothetical protein
MYSFDRLETNQFFPKDNYIQKCVEADPVRRYLDKARYRKSVYVITGIKTVHGAKAKSIKHRVIGGNLGVEVDGTLLSGGMVPVGGGPDTDVKVGKKISTNFEGGSDFVFAFRVKKVTVTRKTGVVKADEDYKKGAMLEKNETELDVPQLLVSKLDDPYPEDEGFEGEELTEDDAIVACAIPKTVDDEDME